jgi:2,3-bisphosphoglycerate-dependent phosphoglycerate mutase
VAIALVFETHSTTVTTNSAALPGGCPANCPARAGCRRGTWEAAAAEMHRGRVRHLDQPYPVGESWRQAVTRVGRFLADLPSRWDGQRVLVIGHVATRWGLDHFIGGTPIEDLVGQDFAWREGWEYRLG